MITARFGDFLDAASHQLRSASRLAAAGLTGELPATAFRQAGRAVAALSRFVDDIVADDMQFILTEQAGEIERAPVYVRDALKVAAASMKLPDTAAATDSALGPLSDRLADAAACLDAGRDLLRTHFATDETGLSYHASHWAAVVTSPAVTQALLAETGRQILRLKLLIAQLSPAVADLTGPGAMAEHIVNADHHLLLADIALGVCLRGRPVTAADGMLLRAIPGNFVPGQMPLTGGEPVDVLCQGATVSAIRLRNAARLPPDEGGWAPELTAESWRWCATAGR